MGQLETASCRVFRKELDEYLSNISIYKRITYLLIRYTTN